MALASFVASVGVAIPLPACCPTGAHIGALASAPGAFSKAPISNASSVSVTPAISRVADDLSVATAAYDVVFKATEGFIVFHAGGPFRAMNLAGTVST